MKIVSIVDKNSQGNMVIVYFMVSLSHWAPVQLIKILTSQCIDGTLIDNTFYLLLYMGVELGSKKGLKKIALGDSHNL
jgi:hypothetical protein